MKRKIILSVFAITLGICSCGNPVKTKIALMTKLEAGSAVGRSEINATKIFIEKYKANDIDVVFYDDAWNPDKTIEAYKKLRKDRIDIIITSHTSACAVGIKEMINHDRVFTLVTGATTNLLSGNDDYIFRNIQDVDLEQKSIASYMNRKGYKNLLVLQDMDNEAYTTPARNFFQKYYVAPVYFYEISISKVDSLYIERLFRNRTFSALYLLIGGYKVTAGTIAQLVRKMSPSIPIYYTPWMKSPELIDTAGLSLNGSIIPSHYPPSGENIAVDSYISLHKEKYGFIPTFISLNVYSALQILYEAISNGNKTPDSIKKYILHKRKFHTDFGDVVFNDFGDVEKDLFFTEITGETIDEIIKNF